MPAVQVSSGYLFGGTQTPLSSLAATPCGGPAAQLSEPLHDMQQCVCCCRCRRAKRLRRILRQLESPAAQAPLARFWRGTWGVVLVLLVVHIICYAVLSTILASRNT